MLPSFSLFGLTIPLYGLMIVSGAGLGFLLTVFKPVYPGLPRQDLVFSAIYLAIGFYVGAKLLYLITLAPFFIRNFRSIDWSMELLEELFSAGFVFYGGLIGGLLMMWLYCKKYQLAFFIYLENLVPALPFIHGLGRVGCFLAGCCYGRPAEPPFGVYFHPDSVAPTGVALFPIQLLEAAINLIIFILVFTFSRKDRKTGQILGLYLLLYPLARFALEYLRADEIRGFLFGLSTSQWLSILLFVLGVIFVSGRFSDKFPGFQAAGAAPDVKAPASK